MGRRIRRNVTFRPEDRFGEIAHRYRIQVHRFFGLPEPAMEQENYGANWPLGLLGAGIGGVLGYYVFKFLLSQGFYGLAIPGALLGLGCGVLSKGHSHALGIVCGVLALILSLFSEWHLRPFIDDDSLGFFLSNLHELSLITLLMLAVGTYAGYWLGQGRERMA